MTFTITSFDSPFGAEITGLDPRKADQDCGHMLREALDKHRLVVIRSGPLEPEEQVAVMATLGTPLIEDGSGNPFCYVDKKEDVFIKGQVGLVYHSDYHFVPQGPARYLSFNAIDVAEDEPTLYADMVATLRHLPADLRARLEDLQVLQCGSYSGQFDPSRRVDIDLVEAGPAEQFPQSWQPAVRFHPFTRERLLNVNQFFSIGFSGLDRSEAETLFKEIDAHAYGSEVTISRGHRNGDFCIWDNIALQHGRPPIPSSRRRYMRRVASNIFTVDEMLAGVRPDREYARISRSPIAEDA